jgi:Ca-activated chloride channel family protein
MTVKSLFRIWLRIVIFAPFCGVLFGQNLKESSVIPLPLSIVPKCDKNNAKVFVNTAVFGQETKTYLVGLTPDKFRISGEKEIYEIRCFSNPDEPFSVGIVIDFSNSIGKNKAIQSIDGIRTFIDSGNTQNKYFAIGFTGKPFILLEPTSDRKAIETFITDAVMRERKGSSALSDAIEMALTKFSPDDNRRKILIVLSDGQDNDSKTDGGAVLKKLRDARIETFVASIVDMRDAYNDERINNEERLAKIAVESGGDFVLRAKEVGLAKYFEKLAKMLRNEYRLGFSPTTAEKKWRPISYAVKVPTNYERITITGVQRFFY